jgi:adenosine deaminase
MMGVDVADEYVAVADAFGHDLEVMEGLSLAALAASWAPPEEKAALRDRFTREFADLRQELAPVAG